MGQVAPASPEGGEGVLRATQVSIGLGMADIGEFEFSGRRGVLIRPRPNHIPFGAAGELQDTVYWPVAGDVVLWLDGSPAVLIEQLQVAAPPPPTTAGSAEGVGKLVEALKEAQWALGTFAILDNEETADLPDEHLTQIVYDDPDPEIGGPNTLLGERFLRAYRVARKAFDSVSVALAAAEAAAVGLGEHP